MKTLDAPAARKSLPMSERDLQDLEKMRSSDPHRAALARISHTALTEGSSDAAVLHAVYEAGLKAVGELVEAIGYQEIASNQDVAARQAAARRRRPAWADDE